VQNQGMERFDTVVIGAGVSGLTAARLLVAAGRSVVILEARDRVGGRLQTDRTDGEVTDLGASWIHGITDSPVAAAAEAFGMRTVEFTVGGYQPDSRPIAYYGPDSVRLSDAEARAFADDVHTIDAALLAVIAASAPDASYRDVTEQALAENLRAFLEALVKAKPTGAKGTYVRKVALSSSQGPGVGVEPSSFTAG